MNTGLSGGKGKIHSGKSKVKNFKGTFKRLLGFTKPYKVRLFIVMAFIVMATLFNSLGPYILGIATNQIADVVMGGKSYSESMPGFIKTMIILSLVYALYSVFGYAGQRIMVSVAERTMFDIRKSVDLKIRKLPLNYFDTNSFGDILSRVTNDVDTVAVSFKESVNQIVSSIMSVIFIFIMMLIVSPILTLVSLIVIPLCMAVTLMITRNSQKFFIQQQQSIGDINGYVEEMYNGHNIIVAFGREKGTINKFEQINQTMYLSGWKAQFMSGIIMPLVQAITNLGYVGISILSGYLCITGRFSVGMIQSFIQYLRKFSQPINQIAQITNTLQSTAAAAERIFEFLDAKEESVETENPRLPEEVKGNVQFEHVKFGYSPNKILIHDFNISINSGDKIAIVGPTGAGKTTLVNLILRFYDINGGHILIDGIDIMNMTREGLRSMIGMVLQDTWLFCGTIMENIRYGRLNATKEQVIEAAKAAHAHDFIETLPGGYNMVLSEGASNIAQGQRQLLTIARAVLASPKILILDEATSSVDTRTEVAIQKAMSKLMEGRTSFVIAHRLSTIKDSEKIIYMENGDIKEVGNHKELISKNGYYAKLYNSQFTKNNAK